jgi:hypothetical protein
MSSMLKITILDSAGELCFRLEGKLSGPWVHEFRQCWQTASSTTAGRSTVADLREVDFVDPDGQQLLSDLRRSGVRLMAATPLIRTLVEEINRFCACGTVEETSRKPSDAVVRAQTSGSHPSAL